MANTIGNPISWTARVLRTAGRDAGAVTREIGGREAAWPEVRRIGVADLREALRRGFDDFAAMRTDVIVLVLLYPVIGFGLIWIAWQRSLLPLIFPLLSGFALIGPAAAVGLYEMSRRREAGLQTGWADGFSVIASPRFGAIFALALFHVALFVVWLIAAYAVFLATMGGAEAAARPMFFTEFLHRALTTVDGWAMIGVGVPLGFVFALAVLATSVVSFPLLLDRSVGLPVAIVTSLKVAWVNPWTILLWGGVVTAGLVLGLLPLLIGLAVALPVLGHATWHLYRRAVA